MRNLNEKELPVKQPLALRALAFKTGSIAFNEHGEKRLLLRLSPEVALANIIKLPSSPPGVHCSGSCCKIKRIILHICMYFKRL